MSKRVLCLLATGFEEIEAITPIDLLRRADAEVILASMTGTREVTGKCSITVRADVLFEDVETQSFDLLLIPGGPAVSALRKDGRAAQLAKAQMEAGKPVAAICAAPLVLADAGLLKDRRFTAHYSVYEELPRALEEERVVEDGDVTTSRGAGTALDFGLALVRRLYGEDKAEEIARSVMA